MLQEFITQNYLIIQNNIVSNVVSWDGDTNVWSPPQGSIALVQATTPSIIWQPIVVGGKTTDWELGEIVGLGDIGFTWDGTAVTTNQPKPSIPTV